MKKTISILLLVCFAFLSVACTEEAEQSKDINASITDGKESKISDSDPEEQSKAEQNESEETDSGEEPPNVLKFDSLEELVEFADLVNREDKEVVEYLSDRNFDINGVSDKKAVEAVVEYFEEINPAVLNVNPESGYELQYIEYSLDKHPIFVLSFYNGKDYLLIRTLTKEKGGNLRENSTVEQVSLGTLALMNGSVEINKSSEGEKFNSNGILFTGDYCLHLLLHDTTLNPELGQYIYMTTINELMEKTK